MSEEKTLTKRELVKLEIEKGTETKAGIAETLEISPGSVSSQMTYLRWMGMFIATDADKVLSFVTEEEFNAIQDEKKANRKTKSTSTKTPEEQAATIAKTLDKQNKQVATWEKKLNSAEVALEDEADNEDLQDLRDEAEANITILNIKIKRNVAKAASLPAIEEVAEVEGDDEELL